MSSIDSHRINCGRLTVSVKLPNLTADIPSKTSNLAQKSAFFLAGAGGNKSRRRQSYTYTYFTLIHLSKIAKFSLFRG